MKLRIQVTNTRAAAVRLPFLKGNPGLAGGASRSFDVTELADMGQSKLQQTIGSYQRNGVVLKVETDLEIAGLPQTAVRTVKPQANVLPSPAEQALAQFGKEPGVRVMPTIDLEVETARVPRSSTGRGENVFSKPYGVVDVDGERAGNLTLKALEAKAAEAEAAAKTAAPAAPAETDGVRTAVRGRRGRQKAAAVEPVTESTDESTETSTDAATREVGLDV